jgi:WD40 repeat protein
MIGHSDWIMRISFSQDGTQLLSSSKDKNIGVWDVTTRKVEYLKGHTALVYNSLFLS